MIIEYYDKALFRDGTTLIVTVKHYLKDSYYWEVISVKGGKNIGKFIRKDSTKVIRTFPIEMYPEMYL